MLVVAQNASSFVSSVGINTHLGWSGTAYANQQQVLAAADYIGIHTFRDVLESSSFNAFNSAAAAGIRFDVESGTSLSTFLSEAHSLAQNHPGSLVALEGPNEVDGWPVSYNGLTGYAGSAAYQQALYTQSNADALLAPLPVYNLTVSGVTPSKYESLGDLSAYADYANVHIYYGGGQPWYGWSQSDPTFWWTSWLNAGQLDAPGRPSVVTEVGNTTYNGGVSESVQAKQMLNALMDAAKSGVSATYIYELVESRYDSGGGDSEAHFGIYRSDWTPKPAATALHNLTQILTDGSTTGGFTAGSLDYTVSGIPSNGGAHLLQEQDGTYDLVVWAEPDIWNEGSHTAIAAPTTSVTVNLANAATVSIYDPLTGVSPVRQLGVTNTFSVEVTDHPLVIEIKGATAPAPTADPAPAPSGATLNGGSGGDDLVATAAMPEVHGGAGDDTITGWSGGDFLAGGDGNDLIQGGSGFDRANGNAGADTVYGNAGDDWLCGGKDGDLVFGGDGRDILNGNLGSDTVDGGAGADVLRGGQGDDLVRGGDGGDLVFGDLGDDTLTGGAGGDVFYASAGVDRITDFRLADGDRVQLAAGTDYTLSQQGGDTVIDLGSGDQLILVGVAQDSLVGGWILTG